MRIGNKLWLLSFIVCVSTRTDVVAVMRLVLSNTHNITLATRLDPPMATVGQLNDFCPESESLTVYIERVELFFTANDIANQQKV